MNELKYKICLLVLFVASLSVSMMSFIEMLLGTHTAGLVMFIPSAALTIWLNELWMRDER